MDTMLGGILVAVWASGLSPQGPKWQVQHGVHLECQSVQEVHSWDLGMDGPVWSLTSAPLLAPCWCPGVGASCTMQCLPPHDVSPAGLCSSGRQAARLFSVPHVVQQETTLAYLENQVAAALTLQSSHEYRHWLLLYARYLVNEGKVPGDPFILLGLARSLSQYICSEANESGQRCSGLGLSVLFPLSLSWLPWRP